jgi:hypothetical protein
MSRTEYHFSRPDPFSPAAESYRESLAAYPYFKQHLAPVHPIRLKDRLPPQIDPLNPSNSFVLFTIECGYADRVFSDD